MDFCPNCGTRLVQKPSGEGNKGSLKLACTKCGYKKPGKQKPTVAPKSIKRSFKPLITVIGKEHQIRIFPTTKKACSNCGNNLVYYWQVQTRGGDEGSTLFFRCTKCDHTFREYT